MHSQIDIAMKKDNNTPDIEYDAEYLQHLFLAYSLSVSPYLQHLDEHLQQEELSHTEYLD